MPSADSGSHPPTDPSKTVSEALISSERTLWPLPLQNLPEKFDHFRAGQVDAIRQIMEHYETGAKVVILDAPPGSGKTLIAESVRRLLQTSGLYICHTKSLQDQFASDFPYASVLKGRSNYPTMREDLFHVGSSWARVTAADCTKTGSDREDPSCIWCDPISQCPYERAKRTLLRSELGVVNGSYYLTESNYVGRLSGAEFIIADECDTLESELLGFVGLDISQKRVRDYDLGEPDKVTKEDSWFRWCDEACSNIEERLGVTSPPTTDSSVAEIREWKYKSDLITDLRRLRRGLSNGGWVYTGKNGRVSFKPIEVKAEGQNALWQHGKRWLLMSGTVVSPRELMDSLGGESMDWGFVSLPSEFKVENRRVKICQVADMSKKGLDSDRDWQLECEVEAIGKIIARHRGERVLVHTVSYDLANDLAIRMAALDSKPRIFTYGNASERDRTLKSFTDGDDGETRNTRILLAPSMDRGIDLPDDLCRVIIIAKVPYPYLGDRQVSARLFGSRSGQTWYDVQTVRKLIQMTGRGVRHDEDWCVSYILDKNFYTGIWNKGRRLFPKWWVEGLDWKDKLDVD